MNVRSGISWVSQRIKHAMPGKSWAKASDPGLKGRSEEHERRTATGVAPKDQAQVTQAQRDLEHNVRH